MGTTDKLQSHGRGFRLQHPGKHPIDYLPALIAMAVAAHRSEMLAAEPLGGEGIEHPGQPRLHLTGVVGGGSSGGGHCGGHPFGGLMGQGLRCIRHLPCPQ